MNVRSLLVAALAVMLVTLPADATPSTNSDHTTSHTKTSTSKSAKATTKPRTSKAVGPARDSHGRILRSGAAKHAFEVSTGYPHGRPGYVVDHIKPLACGGADDTTNMQWQTVAEGKAKDKWERNGCK